MHNGIEVYGAQGYAFDPNDRRTGRVISARATSRTAALYALNRLIPAGYVVLSHTIETARVR